MTEKLQNGWWRCECSRPCDCGQPDAGPVMRIHPPAIEHCSDCGVVNPYMNPSVCAHCGRRTKGDTCRNSECEMFMKKAG